MSAKFYDFKPVSYPVTKVISDQGGYLPFTLCSEVLRCKTKPIPKPSTKNIASEPMDQRVQQNEHWTQC